MRICTLLFLLAISGMSAMAQVRVSPVEALKSVTSKVPPEYSPIAKQMKVVGHVEVDVIVAADGAVESVKALSGNPLLTGPTVTAVKKWKFNPIVVSGAPVRAVATLPFEFK